jgi:transcriptional regulator GlxA family with amidase domain
MQQPDRRIHVSLLVIPDVMIGSLTGMFDVLNSFELLSGFDDALPASNPFRPEIVAPVPGGSPTASGLPVPAHRSIGEVERSDIVIVPSLAVQRGDWRPGRYPAVVEWLSAIHARGGVLCSACSGVLLLAETGLLDGHEATIHWAYARTFRQQYPEVRLQLEKVLVVSGERREFVMAGASASWHDLVLYLVARYVGPTAAQAMAKFFLLQRHEDGQAPYVTFDAPTDHGDAVVRRVQEWLTTHFALASPVEEMVKQSGLSERSFKRRFRKATGLSPIAYVQHLRVEDAKRRLERTDAPADRIGWAAGYEDATAFLRLFKRITRLTPSAYRRKFRLPEPAAPGNRETILRGGPVGWSASAEVGARQGGSAGAGTGRRGRL